MESTAHGGKVCEQRGAALQRVDGPEGTVEPRGVARAALQGHEIVARRLHEFAPLDQELVEQLVHHAAGGRWYTTASSKRRTAKRSVMRAMDSVWPRHRKPLGFRAA